MLKKVILKVSENELSLILGLTNLSYTCLDSYCIDRWMVSYRLKLNGVKTEFHVDRFEQGDFVRCNQILCLSREPQLCHRTS